jgi:hypothetical protein
MKVTMMIADAAQAVGGKLYILGGGWSITGPEPAPSALAMKIEVPWTEANRPHAIRLALVDADGQPVIAGDKALEITAELEVGRPAGLPAGTPLDASLVFNLPPLPLAGGRRYVWRVWRLAIDGEARDDWSVAFMTRSP